MYSLDVHTDTGDEADSSRAQALVALVTLTPAWAAVWELSQAGGGGGRGDRLEESFPPVSPVTGHVTALLVNVGCGHT